jgi:hypothetical protein
MGFMNLKIYDMVHESLCGIDLKDKKLNGRAN